MANAERLQVIVRIHLPQWELCCGDELVSDAAPLSSTPSGSQNLINCLMASCFTACPLWSARRRNHRYPRVHPLRRRKPPPPSSCGTEKYFFALKADSVLTSSSTQGILLAGGRPVIIYCLVSKKKSLFWLYALNFGCKIQRTCWF